MKFHEIPIGQQFEFEDEVYVKTAPLVASHAQSGKQKFMARYVVVKLTGEITPVVVVQSKTIRIGAVVSAFDDFYEHCLQEIENLPAEKQGAARETLLEARKVFLDSLH